MPMQRCKHASNPQAEIPSSSTSVSEHPRSDNPVALTRLEEPGIVNLSFTARTNRPFAETIAGDPAHLSRRSLTVEMPVQSPGLFEPFSGAVRASLPQPVRHPFAPGCRHQVESFGGNGIPQSHTWLTVNPFLLLGFGVAELFLRRQGSFLLSDYFGYVGELQEFYGPDEGSLFLGIIHLKSCVLKSGNCVALPN